MPQKSAADIVAEARKAYVSAGGGKITPASTKEASNAKPTPAVAQTTAPAKPATTMDELKARKDNIAKVMATLPKMHSGGPVKKDGAYQLKAGEHVLTAAEASRARKHALISAGLRSMATPMNKGSKSETPKDNEKKTATSVKPKAAEKKISVKK